MNKKIVVGTNSLTSASYEAYTNHCQFWFDCGRNMSKYDFIFCNPARMSIDVMRNMAAGVALGEGAEYLVFLDDDVLVPMDGLSKLVACDADISAGNVLVRGYPFDYMFFKRTRVVGKGLDPRLETYKTIEGEPLIIRDTDGLGAVGFSFACIKIDLIRKMKPPYFVTTRNTTEDIYFCIKATEAFPETSIAVDTSVVCGHILWPEIISHKNRTAYAKYFEKINDIPLAERKSATVAKNNEEDMLKLMQNMTVG
jgi:hypothetical protein